MGVTKCAPEANERTKVMNAVSALMLLGSAVISLLGSVEYATTPAVWAIVFAVWSIRDEIKKAAK